jgi:20S proteasome subunit alpha 4
VQEFLEKNWTANLTEKDSIRLTIKALLEVVDSGSKNMELAVSRYGQPMRLLKEEEVQEFIADIEREIEEAKKSSQEATGSGAAPMET